MRANRIKTRIIRPILFGLLSFVLIPMPAKAQTMVYLERSETLSFDQERIADAQILKGNVRFRHDYFFERSGLSAPTPGTENRSPAIPG